MGHITENGTLITYVYIYIYTCVCVPVARRPQPPLPPIVCMGPSKVGGGGGGRGGLYGHMCLQKPGGGGGQGRRIMYIYIYIIHMTLWPFGCFFFICTYISLGWSEIPTPLFGFVFFSASDNRHVYIYRICRKHIYIYIYIYICISLYGTMAMHLWTGWLFGNGSLNCSLLGRGHFPLNPQNAQPFAAGSTATKIKAPWISPSTVAIY